jgi:hypothetical protein
MNKARTHTLKIGKSRIDIYHENRRLYKFVDWKKSKPVLREFLIKKVVEARPQLLQVPDLDVNMESVNPMRTSMLGGFYLEVKGEVTGEGLVIARFSDLDIKNVKGSGMSYDCHDPEETKKRIQVEKTFGKDQYYKEEAIRMQAIDSLKDTLGGKIVLESSADVDKFVTEIMVLTGWSPEEDNRLHSRVKRLPPYMEVPE